MTYEQESSEKGIRRRHVQVFAVDYPVNGETPAIKGLTRRQEQDNLVIHHNLLPMFRLRHLHQIKWSTLQVLKRSYMARKERPVLTLFTKNPCPLCDEAKEVLAPYMDRFILEQVDITLPENTAWYERYKHDIPVFHLNGQFLMMHRVNIKKLEKYLRNLEQEDILH
ncbi:glutaredoxin-like protein C5orf63 homolog [Mixophyes fleayi]|uniref:glutaredoxin-like protein C5orf63 homolog n=1 Tax=Mixophyes fleayi TaxID=3061075 RepID=UPI003F4E17EF